MKNPKPKSDWLDELRRRAEDALGKEKGKDWTDADALAWMHELQVHQTELEMQNEELKRSRQELEESRNKYLELYEFLPIGYFTLDKQGAILEVNLSGAALLGIERKSLAQRRFQLFVEPDLRPEFNAFCDRVFGENFKQTGELWLVKNDGSRLYVCLEGVTLRDGEGDMKRCQIAVVDITKQKRAQEEEARLKDRLSHAQKLASVGILAGGVAHNFNNLLMVIMGYATILLTEMKEGDTLGEYTQRIIHATQMAANLAKDLLAFSRKKPVHLQSVNINATIKDAKDIVVKLVRENSRFRTSFTESDCFVMADSDQIIHVLMNLATNARDAMPNGGELNICTEIVEMDDAFIRAHGFGEIGKYALISFSDTGAGMDDDTRMRIFEPFFTTKEVGKGTGLGLATVYGIIKQHNGYIDVESKKGDGTTFRIYLPAVTKMSHVKTAAEITPKAGTETVLLAEDEMYVRDLIKTVFEINGYKVITAVDGRDAIDKFIKNRDKINLLLFDIVMPIKSGKEAYEEIKKINPDIKILFMSGYDDSTTGKIDIITDGLDYISKPVSPLKLLEKTREALDR